MDLKELNSLYKKKINISDFLSRKTNLKESDIINISYDLQSGTYIKAFNKKGDEKFEKFQNLLYMPIINKVNKNFPHARSILDFGAGELINTLYLIKRLKKIKNFFACDISFNRLYLGKKFIENKLNKNKLKKLSIFCSSHRYLPFADNSIDIIITMHSLEPNRKGKNKLIRELYRVSQYGLILFEPHYEIASKKQKKRMDKLKYIKGLEKTIKSLNCKYEIIPLDQNVNKLNCSSLFVLYKNNFSKKRGKNKTSYVDAQKSLLSKVDNFLYSKNNFKIYPILSEIPIFSETTNIFLPKK